MSTNNDIAKLGTILSVGAHPDDETFISGGVLAAAAKNGQTVVCVTATKGEAGVQDAKRWPPEQLADVRADELKKALTVLGISKHHWLGYQDGECTNVNSREAVSKLTKFIKQYQPDTILTFGADGLTGHPDHCQVSQWVTDAVQQSGRHVKILHAVTTKTQYDNYLRNMDDKLNIFYNIAAPKLVEPMDCALYFNLPDDIARLKYDAFARMPSQTEAMLRSFDKEYVREAFAVEAFITA